MPWTSKNPYFGENETAADLLWEDINIDNGTVALEDSYVEALGLPTSQRFPWDERKGIYILNGFHSMHCLVSQCNAPLHKYYNLSNAGLENHQRSCLGIRSQSRTKGTHGAYPPLSGCSEARYSLLCRRYSTLYGFPRTRTLRHRTDSPMQKLEPARSLGSKKHGMLAIHQPTRPHLQFIGEI